MTDFALGTNSCHWFEPKHRSKIYTVVVWYRRKTNGSEIEEYVPLGFSQCFRFENVLEICLLFRALSSFFPLSLVAFLPYLVPSSNNLKS